MSKSFSHSLPVVGAIVLASAFVPVAGYAQTAQPAPQGAAMSSATDDLEHDAEILLEVPSQRNRAAGMLERAGFQRQSGDTRAVSDLLIAASAYYWTGQKERARDLFTRTGERALSFGDVAGSADAFLRAAWIANEQHDPAGVIDLVGRVERLAGSPLLSEEQRQGILRHIQDPQKLALGKR